MGHKFELLFVGEHKPDLFSWLIQRGQRRIHGVAVNFSHVAILVNDERVFDSTGRGFGECPLLELVKPTENVIRHRFHLQVPEDVQDDALAWLRGRKGIPYSWLQGLGVVFPFLRRVPFVKNGFKRAFCSESGADFLFEWCVSKRRGGQGGARDRRLHERDWIDPYTLKCIAHDYGEEV